jgi:hypothetical protein
MDGSVAGRDGKITLPPCHALTIPLSDPARNQAAYPDVYVTAGVLQGASSARVGREEPRVRLTGKNACGAGSGAA